MNREASTPAVAAEVEAVLVAYPEEMRAMLLGLRALIYEVSETLGATYAIEETLKWGEPSYLTCKPRTGSTIRLDWKAEHPQHCSVFFKCTADLVPAFRQRFSETFTFGGKRSINFAPDDAIPIDSLKQCLALALSYHHNKKLDVADRWDFIERLMHDGPEDC